MPSAQAKPLHASSLQQELLQKMAHRTTSAQRLVKRAQIILEALNPRVAQRAWQSAEYNSWRRQENGPRIAFYSSGRRNCPPPSSRAALVPSSARYPLRK
jgi:hypothetical protein